MTNEILTDIRQIIELARNKPHEFIKMEEHFYALSKLTGRNEYHQLYCGLRVATTDRLASEMAEQLIIFAKFGDYTLEDDEDKDENGYDRECTFLKLAHASSSFSLIAFPYFFVHFLKEKPRLFFESKDLAMQAELNLHEALRVLETEAYKAICRTNEKLKLDFAMLQKENSTSRTPNKI